MSANYGIIKEFCWGWYSFRRRDLNRLFCKSKVRVKYKI